jgi:hypothetical protein
MTSVQLKTNFHKLIDEIDNDSMLHKFYEILSSAKNQTKGALWRKLSVNQQNELTEREKLSHDEANLVAHQVMIEKNKEGRS